MVGEISLLRYLHEAEILNRYNTPNHALEISR